MSVLIVTGTSTDVGKTIATAAITALALAQRQRVLVIKPAQTGEPDDPTRGDLAVVRALTGITTTAEFARYPEPLAPDIAALRSGRPLLAFDDVCHRIRALDAPDQLTIVEGAGGVLVRLGAHTSGAMFSIADVAAALGAPAVVVAAPALGTLNHAQLTAEALAARGVRNLGTIVGTWPVDREPVHELNREQLPDVTGTPVLGAIPDGSGQLTPSQFREQAPSWFTEAGASLPGSLSGEPAR